MKVFISYARENADIADQILRLLGKFGIDSFLDIKDLEWGEK